jgi:hypothetical protein
VKFVGNIMPEKEVRVAESKCEICYQSESIKNNRVCT